MHVTKWVIRNRPGEQRHDGAFALAYVAIALVPVIVAATHRRFWSHGLAPLASLLYLGLLVSLLMRREWAWRLLLLLDAAALALTIVEGGADPSLVASTAIGLALLLSAPVRRYAHPVRTARDERPTR